MGFSPPLIPPSKRGEIFPLLKKERVRERMKVMLFL